MNAPFPIGLVGLGVMGQNLALNLNDRGAQVVAWNLQPELTAEFLSQPEAAGIRGVDDLASLASELAQPRVVLLMIQAGSPVDEVLRQLLPALDPGDMVIDGGNSHYLDTERRAALAKEHSVHFCGLGVSGGEEGARRGPSLMFGGDAAAWLVAQPLLQRIAARANSGVCAARLGDGGAGHFVKMVHNGIEYAVMQLIAECYDLLTRGLDLSASEAAAVFAEYNAGKHSSFLLEITAKALSVIDRQTGQPLVDLVEDRAAQKGTGRWTVQSALELGVAVPSISAAVDARTLSSLKDERLRASKLIRGRVAERPNLAAPKEPIRSIGDALFAATLCSYAQGFALIRQTRHAYGWDIPADEVARIWQGGCIIRAAILQDISEAFRVAPDLEHLLISPSIESQLYETQPALREIASLCQALGIAAPALCASLAYLDSYRAARLPQNLTQAQRDAFGAHRYIRVDDPDRKSVHTDWLGPSNQPSGRSSSQ